MQRAGRICPLLITLRLSAISNQGTRTSSTCVDDGNMRHHYIPQWLLRNFQDSNGKIHAFRKANPARGIFTTTPINLMVERHFYTLRGESGPARQKAEEEYSRRETLAKPVADKIIAAARNNTRPGLTLKERLFIHLFHCDTWRRTPDIAAEKDKLMGPFDHDAFLAWYGKERNLNARDFALARDLLHDPDTQKIIDHNARVMAAAGPPAPGCFQVPWRHGARDCASRKTEQEFRHR